MPRSSSAAALPLIVVAPVLLVLAALVEDVMLALRVAVLGDIELGQLSLPAMKVSPPPSTVNIAAAGDMSSVLTVPGLKPSAEDVAGDVSESESFSSTMRVRPAAKTKYGTKHGVRRRVKRLA
jgi:hypothetical protein